MIGAAGLSAQILGPGSFRKPAGTLFIDYATDLGGELARPRRPKAARSAVAALRAAGPSKLGPYISCAVRSRFSFIVMRGPALAVSGGRAEGRRWRRRHDPRASPARAGRVGWIA